MCVRLISHSVSVSFHFSSHSSLFQVLEGLELTPETEAQWIQLAAAALDVDNVPVAERCYAAVGDLAKVRAAP